MSIAVVFAVLGTNEGIFSSLSYQTAIGAGWILLAIVDVSFFRPSSGHKIGTFDDSTWTRQILWLLCLTADDDTRLSLVFSSYAGDSPTGRTHSMRQSRRASSALAISNPSASDLHSHGTHHIATGNTYASGGQGYGPGSAKTRISMQSGNSHIMPGVGMGVGSPNMGSLNGSNEMAMQSQQSLPQQPAGAQPQPSAGQPAEQQTSAEQMQPKRAKALYGYTASPDDANEIGFSKGEVLDILDSSGKWFSARKQDGTQGIVPRCVTSLTILAWTLADEQAVVIIFNFFKCFFEFAMQSRHTSKENEWLNASPVAVCIAVRLLSLMALPAFCRPNRVTSSRQCAATLKWSCCNGQLSEAAYNYISILDDSIHRDVYVGKAGGKFARRSIAARLPISGGSELAFVSTGWTYWSGKETSI